MIEGLHSLKDLTEHFKTRIGYSHAPPAHIPIITFSKKKLHAVILHLRLIDFVKGHENLFFA